MAVTERERVEGWISCPRCSRRARAGQPFCESCGLELATPAPSTETRRALTCPECGATSVVPDGERTATCPFCGAAYVAGAEPDAARQSPEFLLPFSVDESKAQTSFREWLGSSSFFAPGDLSRKASVGGLRGLYVPFWSFSMRSASVWNARIGEYWYETVTETYTTTENGKTVTKTRTKQVRHTEWYPLEGRFHQFHSHHLICASRGLAPNSLDKILPFPVGELTRYAPHYLAGWLAEEYSVDRETALADCSKIVHDLERRAVQEFLPGDTSADLHLSTELHDVTGDLVYLPLWILGYRYAGKPYQYVLNGATGKGHGDRPVSAWKVALLIAFILAAVLLIIFLFNLRGGG